MNLVFFLSLLSLWAQPGWDTRLPYTLAQMRKAHDEIVNQLVQQTDLDQVESMAFQNIPQQNLKVEVTYTATGVSRKANFKCHAKANHEMCCHGETR